MPDADGQFSSWFPPEAGRWWGKLYYRLIPTLAVVLVVCCLVWALASAFGGNRVSYGGYSPPIFVGSGWNHGSYYHGSYGGGSSSSPASSFGGSSGRSPSSSFRGSGVSGGHGGK